MAIIPHNGPIFYNIPVLPSNPNAESRPHHTFPSELPEKKKILIKTKSARNTLKEKKMKKVQSARHLPKNRFLSRISPRKKPEPKVKNLHTKELSYIFVENPIAPFFRKKKNTPEKIAATRFSLFVKNPKKTYPTDLVFIASIFNQHPTLLKPKTLLKLHRAIDECDLSLASQFAPFTPHQHFFTFLESRICFEISKARKSKLLFREDAFVTRLVTQYLKFIGREFLRSTLHQIVLKEESQLSNNVNIKSMRFTGSLDTVPTKKQLNRIEKNKERCVKTASLILETLSENLQKEIPLNRKIKNFFSSFHSCIKNKFGINVARELTLSTFFLKFISPSLFAPAEYGTVEQWNPLTPAPFKYPAKILQLIGNFCPQEPMKVPEEISFSTHFVNLSETHQQIWSIYKSSIGQRQPRESILHHNGTCIKWPKDRKRSKPKEQGSLQSKEESNSLKKG